jgi:hypothetical protein
MSSAPPPPPPMSAGGGASTNGLAIASLVLGILGVVTCGYTFFIAPILAVVLGVVARKQIAERGQAGDGMAKAGLALGIVGLVISVLLIVFVIVLGVFGGNA